MKTQKICGWICLGIALLLVLISVYGHILSKDDIPNAYFEATTLNNRAAACQTANQKTAPSAGKKASAAVQAAENAVKDSQNALAKAEELISSYSSAHTGNTLLDAALKTANQIENNTLAYNIEGAFDFTDIAVRLRESALETLLATLGNEYDSAWKSYSSAQGKVSTAVSGISDVYTAIGSFYEAPELESSSKMTCSSPEDYLEALNALCVSADRLASDTASLLSDAQQAQAKASEAAQSVTLSFIQRIYLAVGSAPIGFGFTAFLFALIGCVLSFWIKGFLRMWKKYTLFSTFIALAVMIVIQVYALGFRFSGYGEWAMYWLKNMLNVLRSNSSVGMIALGMTFVIITGGIDLAVGSNLAGVATVVMVCLDVSGKGFLTSLGVTGTWNYLIAIFAGLLTGAVLGALTGLGITKGRIPPFIFTLGVMNIVRSVAQYFTKSYKPEVPKAFQVIANHEIIGDQMLLPIIYWLVLAAIMYVISAHTAFGRHIFAVGSNEKASRLSGIDVDRVKLAVYILMGVIVAVAAVVSVARLRGVDVASAGNGYEMNAIAAVVVGGTSMAGGRGSIIGTVFGVLIIGIMNNLLVLVGVDAFLSAAFTGAIIIFAVLIQKKDR